MRELDQIRDSLGHIIPDSELDRRTRELGDVLELFKEHPVVILTAEENGSGKSTFGRILRNEILKKPKDPPFSDCLFLQTDQISIAYREPRRQDRFTDYDYVSYPDLVRFCGVIILDEVYPEYVPLALTMKKARLLLIVQPNFLKGPPFDDAEHEAVASWLEKNKVPVYKLKSYMQQDLSSS